MHTRSRLRARWRHGLIVLAVALACVTISAGHVNAAAPEDRDVTRPGSAVTAPDPAGGDSASPVPIPQLEVPGSGKKVPAFRSLSPTKSKALPGSEDTTRLALDPAAVAAGRSRLRPVDASAADRRPADRSGHRSVDAAADAQSFYCDEFIDPGVRVGQDESGAQVLRMDYYGDVLCNFYLYEATGVTAVIDRTPFNDGRVLDVGDPFHFVEDFYGASTGDFELVGDIDPRARSVEVIEEVYLYSPIPWGACNDLPGLRYLLCEGLGGNLLHVIVGTGAFRTGLQDPPPLIMGQGQGRGCDVGLSAAAKNKRTLLGNEHVVDVEFSGTIACSGVPGITGTSEARLVDLSAPLADISGGASGTSGTSSKTVTYRESGRGGRKVKAVYSGRTEAPPGRTWDGCVGRDFETSRTLFTQCQVNGNVITWQAEAPFPDFVGDGAMLDTGLPPERNCQLRPEPPTVVDGKLRATGIGSCDEPIRSITVDAKLSGTYIDDQGVERTVDLRAAGTDEDRDGRADAVIEATCQPGNQQRVTYTLNVTARFRHPDLPPESGWPSQAGWEQGPSFLESERGGVECVPVP